MGIPKFSSNQISMIARKEFMISPKTLLRCGLALLLFMVTRTGALGQTGPSSRILVANQDQSTLQFFDLATGRLLKEVPTLQRPHEIVLDRQRNLAYVSISYRDGHLYNYKTPSHEIQVIDLDKMQIAETIDLTPHWGPHGMALHPTSNLLYVTCESNGGELIAVDLRKKAVVGSVKLEARHPHWVALVPSRNKAYTANKETPHVSVVDLNERKLLKKIPAPNGTEGIIATGDGRYVFAGVQKGNDLLVIDPEKDAILDPVSFDQTPNQFALSALGDKLYVLFFNQASATGRQAGEGVVQEVDLKTLRTGRKVVLPPFPINMVITPEGRTGVVSSLTSNSVSVIELPTLRVTRTIKTGVAPHGVVVF